MRGLRRRLGGGAVTAGLTAALFLSGCGDEPPLLPEVVANVGAVTLTGSIQSAADSTFSPDSIEVTIDSRSWGRHSNPCTLGGILAGEHLISARFTFRGRGYATPAQSAAIGFQDTLMVELRIRTGAIAVSGFLVARESRVEEDPDSIGVILDGDSLGVFVNPGVVPLVPEGLHRLVIFARDGELSYVSFEQTVGVVFGEMAASRAGMMAGGVLLVEALSEGALVDSFSLALDGTDYGYDAGPRTVPNVPAGAHRIALSAPGDTVELGGWERGIMLQAAETTAVTVAMAIVSPDSGFLAPDIACEDLEGRWWSLAEHRGEVMYLYFFEHT